MREIKFRGKRIDNNEWVYGYFTKNHKSGKCYITTQSESGGAKPHQVIPETIGQYTGLKDKNGKEIYEGDICNCREYECFGKVEWNNEEAGFYFCVVVEGGGFEEEHLYDYIDELEVIGNIHDNPELLEVV